MSHKVSVVIERDVHGFYAILTTSIEVPSSK